MSYKYSVNCYGDHPTDNSGSAWEPVNITRFKNLEAAMMHLFDKIPQHYRVELTDARGWKVMEVTGYLTGNDEFPNPYKV